MATAELHEGVIAVRTRWDEKDLIKRVPGSRWNAELKLWTLPLSWASAVTLRGVFGVNLQLGPEFNQWGWSEKSLRVDRALEVRNLLEPTWSTPEGILPEGQQLYPFQEVGRTFLLRAFGALLGDEMGTGKTIQALTTIASLGTEGLPAIVVCPNSIKRQWAEQAAKWLPNATPYIVAGPAGEKRRVLAAAAKDPSALVIVNIEAVRLHSRLESYGSVRLKRCDSCDKRNGEQLTPAQCEVHPKELNGFGFKIAILDEAHRVKDPKAKQTRAIWSVFHDPSVQYRFAMTGTPIANHPGDLWPIMHAVAPQDFPRKSSFLDRYALMSYNVFGGVEVVGLRPDTKDELFAILDPRFRRVTKDIVLKFLPDKIRTVRTVTMSPKQKKAYDEIEQRLVTRLDDGTLLVAKSNLTAATRLLQLASSYAEIDRGEDPDDVTKWTVNLKAPSPKVDELVEIIHELGTAQVAVAAEHRKLIELAVDRLTEEGISCVQVTGAIPELVRAGNLAQFQAGGAQVILFTYKAGGVGLDMTRAGTLVRLQRSWSLVDNKQGEDRVHRIGSEIHEAVNIIDLVAENTIEIQQMERLALKLERLEEITRDRQSRIAAGLAASDLDQEEIGIMNTYLGDV